MKLTEDPHRRLNPLTNEWVLVSPHRAGRPWQGQVEKITAKHEPEYDPTCYLCPGNPRAGGVVNPRYPGTFVFDNDFAALKPGARDDRLDLENRGLLVAEGEPGLCRVICFSPRHDLTLATMSPKEIESVIQTWAAQFQELAQLPQINHVQIFENRGSMMGASNPHPHCQLSHSLHLNTHCFISFTKKRASCEPSGVIRRIRRLPMSATMMLLERSIATPHG